MHRIATRAAALASVAAMGIAPVAVAAGHHGTTRPTHSSTAATSSMFLKADGRYHLGKDLDLTGDAGVDRKGASWMRATVVGPHGIKGVMSPGADAGHLMGTVHIPAALRGSWIRLTLIAPDGRRVSTIVHKG